jgi:hypothetical protein
MTRFISSKIAPRSAGLMPGSDGSHRMRPSTQSMMKNMVPMTLSSSHRAQVFGTGTSLPASAEITRYSRSTAWALGSSLPGGLLRSTYLRLLAVSR